MSLTPFYQGRGERAPQRAATLPPVDPEALRAPAGYRATPGLAAAVDVALTLGMPLLLTGEPGSGKSGLADSLAWELGLDPVLRFTVKSDTESRDLFYRFDTVGRFHAAQTSKDEADAHPARFISFEALGLAILRALPVEVAQGLRLPEQALDHPGEPRRSVVLIDEIDKAPRDVPNDILVEIETMGFQIPELCGAQRSRVEVGLSRAEQHLRPIVIFTSNSEKALPDPFLRRCVYYHLEFPEFDAQWVKAGRALRADRVTVDSIVAARLGQRYAAAGEHFWPVGLALEFFQFLRGDGARLERRPTLAEALAWLDYLMPIGVPPAHWSALAALAAPGDADAEARLAAAIATLLLKKPGDQRQAVQLLTAWRDANATRT
jgi:MoxR-like ATPase